MKLIPIIATGLLLAGPALAARETGVPAPSAGVPASSPALVSDCDAKGCPRQDQNGQAPVSCEHKYGMATLWHCVLICHYPASQWGTLVDASGCK